MKQLLLAVCAFGLSAPALAGTTTFTGDTTGGPTFNRPVTNGNSAPTTLSLVGTDVAYGYKVFSVDTSGSYDFVLTGVTPAGWDTYLGLYASSFDPDSSLVNALIYNDDFPNIGVSGFSYALTAGASYIALVTGFDNDDAGAWSLEISGPGVITGGDGAVPEPATWAMLIAGFGMAGCAMRARRRTVHFA